MRLVVTGATGLLGNNVTRLALQERHEVIAISRGASKAPALADLPVTKLDADITDPAPLNRIDGPIDAVIHCAAHIHIGWTRREEALHTNTTGTRNALNLARDRNARFIHVSTVNTLTIGKKNAPADENTQGDGQVPCTYVLSKRAAEKETLDAIAHGLDAIIVYPGFMLGPWDWKPSSGRMICDLANGAPPLAPAGGCSICDPRDVAQAILRAVSCAPSGSRYILAGENWTYLELWGEITRQFSKRQPWTFMRLPARFIAGTAGDLYGRLTGKEPIINSAAIAMASQFHWYSSQRAIDQLDYNIRPVSDSIRDAIAWLQSHKILR
jgi:dihydroflavonol-4-reductase